jgi:hypothetical protein
MQVKVISPGRGFTAGVIISSKLVPVYEPSPGDYWVAGVAGAKFAIEVDNLGSRAEVLCSIDGRNTLKDEEASWDTNQGLVIPAYGSYRFDVWRTSLDGGREFVFGDEITESVVAQVGGDTENAGVIGLAMWQEQRPQPRPYPPVYDSYRMTRERGPGGQSVVSYTNESAPVTAAAAGPAMDLSTGIGAYKSDHLGTTSFKRGTGPDILLVKYASQAALEAAGIAVYHGPKAFPGSEKPAVSGYERLSSPKK